MKRSRNILGFAGLLLMSVPGIGHGFSIFNVQVLPANPVPPVSEAGLAIQIITPSLGGHVYQPSEVSISGSNVVVDVFPTSGLLTAIGWFTETVNLGVLPAGSYQYEVRLRPNLPTNWGTRTNRGNFLVSPGLPEQAVVTVEAAGPITAEPLLNAIIAPGVFTISRTGPTNFPMPVYIKLSGTASNGVDYVTISNSVIIPTGQRSANVLVQPLRDGLLEPTETVILTVQGIVCPAIHPPPPECYIVGVPSEALVNILDNDPATNQPPVVTIIASDPIASEGTNCFRWPGWTMAANLSYGGLTNTAKFVVSRTGPTNQSLTVFCKIEGSASNGVDYTALPGTITIPAGQRTASLKVVPADDGLIEPVETVVLTLQPSPEYSRGHSRKAAAIIVDNDHPRPGNSWLPDNCFHLTRPAANGECYRVETSTNLIHWTTVCATVVSDGAFHFVDPDADAASSRFYRVVPDAGAAE